MQRRIDELWDWDDPIESERRFRAAADAATDDRERRTFLTQAARALGLQDRTSDALALLDELSPARDEEVAVRLLLERGRALRSGGQPNDARPLFEAAVARAEAAALEHLAVDALHMIAIVAAPDEQIALTMRAIGMAKHARDARAREWLASLYNNLGWTHFEAGDLQAALRSFEQALREREKRDQPRETAIARWAVARALRAQGHFVQALELQLVVARSQEGDGVDDPYVDEEIGECLLALDRADEARPYFRRAAEGLSADRALAELEPARIQRLARLGRG